MHLLRSLTVGAVTLAAVLSTQTPAQALVNEGPASSASFNAPVRAVAVYGNVIYVAGNFTRATDSRGTFKRYRLAALNATNGRLLKWHPAANGPVNTIKAYRGRVYVGGAFTRMNGRGAYRLAKLDARSGALDLRFRGAVNRPVRTIALTRGRIYIGGDFTKSLGYRRLHLVAYNRYSNRITTWHPSANGGVDSLRTKHGLVWAAGSFTTMNRRSSSARVAAISPRSGGVSSYFRMRMPYPVRAMRVTRSRVYLATAGPGGHLYARSSRGAPLWHRTFDGDANSIGLYDRTIYVGGHWTYLCGTDAVAPQTGDCNVNKIRVPRAAAFDGSGRRVGWAPKADSNLGVTSIETSTRNDSIYLGGGFLSFRDGARRQPSFAIFRD